MLLLFSCSRYHSRPFSFMTSFHHQSLVGRYSRHSWLPTHQPAIAFFLAEACFCLGICLPFYHPILRKTVLSPWISTEVEATHVMYHQWLAQKRSCDIILANEVWEEVWWDGSAQWGKFPHWWKGGTQDGLWCRDICLELWQTERRGKNQAKQRQAWPRGPPVLIPVLWDKSSHGC